MRIGEKFHETVGSWDGFDKWMQLLTGVDRRGERRYSRLYGEYNRLHGGKRGVKFGVMESIEDKTEIWALAIFVGWGILFHLIIKSHWRVSC